MKFPYVVRKQSSGRTLSETYIVVRNPGAQRVSVHGAISKVTAQHEADQLNIGTLVRDYADDPRPYAVKRAEAEQRYQEMKGA